MKPRRIKIFSGNALSDVVNYVRIELNKYLNDVFVTLGNISFADNFSSFSTSFTLAAGATVSIRNELKTPALSWIVTDITGDNRLVRVTGWTNELVFLKNVGAVEISATVVFLRG